MIFIVQYNEAVVPFITSNSRLLHWTSILLLSFLSLFVESWNEIAFLKQGKILLNPKFNMKKFALLLFFIGGLVSAQAQDSISMDSINKPLLNGEKKI